jgi:hypothetical protein
MRVRVHGIKTEFAIEMISSYCYLFALYFINGRMIDEICKKKYLCVCDVALHSSKRFLITIAVLDILLLM